MTPQALLQWMIKLQQDVSQTNHHYPHNLVPGWPIPFFGEILRARVVTVGVNPSNQEFNQGRQWDQVTNPQQWMDRLLSYFCNPAVPRWPGFEVWSICLALLERSYEKGEAAHMDVSPRPTIPMLAKATDPAEFRKMVEHDVQCFFQFLSSLEQVQLLLVAGPIPMANGRKQQLADFICQQAGLHNAKWIPDQPLPRLITPRHPRGIPVFVCPYDFKVDGLYAMVRDVYRNRDLLRSLIPPAGPIP